MKCVVSEEMRALDLRTIEENGTPGEVLMDRAGRCVADQVRRLIDLRELGQPYIQLLAGRGNNGGDVFTAARHLSDLGFRLDVFLAGTIDSISGDARIHLQRILERGIQVLEWSTLEHWQHARATVKAAPILVDGLLGTGTKGPVRGPIAGAIEFIQAARQSLVIAIDVPSGLDPDTGDTTGAAVQADMTITMGLPKRGLIASNAANYVGELEVADIGFPQEYLDDVAGDPDCQLLDRSDVQPLLPKRQRQSHKGNYGHVLLIGGSLDYSGAIILAARAAIRSGAGLVTVLTPKSIVERVASACPEIMVRAAIETSTGSLSADNANEWRRAFDGYDAILLGPGLTQHADSLPLTRFVIREATVPLVLDADALQVLDHQLHWLEKAAVPPVITPHPKEFARLLGKDVDDIQAHRIEYARQASTSTGATILLKGAQSVIAHPGEPSYVNPTGNPGMATAGSGDVLAGMVVALLGQGLSSFNAARVAVWLHGRAGDLIAWNTSAHSLTASDLIDELPYAFKALETA